MITWQYMECVKYKVCEQDGNIVWEHGGNIECVNRVAVCEHGGNIECVNRLAI